MPPAIWVSKCKKFWKFQSFSNHWVCFSRALKTLPGGGGGRNQKFSKLMPFQKCSGKCNFSHSCNRGRYTNIRGRWLSSLESLFQIRKKIAFCWREGKKERKTEWSVFKLWNENMAVICAGCLWSRDVLQKMKQKCRKKFWFVARHHCLSLRMQVWQLEMDTHWLGRNRRRIWLTNVWRNWLCARVPQELASCRQCCSSRIGKLQR